MALLSEMREVNLEPNVISYNSGVRACRMGEQWQLALEATLEPAVIISLPEGMLKEEAAQMAVKSAEGEDDPIWCMGKTRKRVSPIGLHVVRRRSGKTRTYSTNHVRRGCAVTTAEVAVSQQWIREQSPGIVEDAAGRCTVGGLTFFTDVVKSRVNESGAVTQIDFREVKPGVSTDHMKQAMGALGFISWALRKHPPTISTKLFLDLPENVDEEVRGCFEALGVEICVWPDMPTSVSEAPSRSPGAEKGEQWQRALAPLSEMLEAKLEPDVISFNAGICACERGKQWQRVLALISEMWRTKLDPDATSYRLAIVALLRREDIAS